MRRAYVGWFLVAVCALLLLGSWLYTWHWAAPENDKAISWIDYWLNRYQTLITGVLAIVGAAIAIYTTTLEIKYDREKSLKAEDDARRSAIRAVLQMVGFSWKVIHSKLNLLSHTTSFPGDAYPSVLMEYEALEQIVLQNLKYLPMNLAERCLYIAYSMKFVNGRIERAHKLEPDRRDELTRERTGAMAQMQAAQICCNVLLFQLGYLATANEDVDPASFDTLDENSIEEFKKMIKSDAPIDLIRSALREMGMTIVARET
jgi:hypothetical protein